MATITAPSRPPAQSLPNFELRVPDRLARVPTWAMMSFIVLVLTAVSVYMRTRYLSGQFWMDEALSVGIASHSLTAIPGVLAHDGSPPLYYLLLHVWISVFGSTETDTHVLSLLFGLLTVPLGAWAAWSLWGRWAAVIAGTLFALNPFITAYSQETRMYTLMSLLGLLATAGFIHGFIYRRRRYLILFAICQALMLYTHAWGIFFGVGAALALIPILRASSEPRAVFRDAVLAFGAAVVLFLPWLPTLLYQATHTGSPWDTAPNFGAPVQISRNLMGGDRATVALVLAASIGLARLFGRGKWRSRESLTVWVLIIFPVGTLAAGWVVSRISPAWQYRYFAPIVASLLLLATLGISRAKGVGVIALVLVVVFWANPASFSPQYKSDMRDVAGELGPLMHKGDLVIVGQPEQVPLTWYYLPAGLRFANVLGPRKDPQSVNWVHALSRLQHANPSAVFGRLIATVKPGEQVLYVRPLTEGARSWQASWTQLVRRRSAQWGALLAADPNLKPIAVAPHNYRGACCVADSAILYKKVS